MICVDTSFLFSLYGNDLHTAQATNYIQKLKSGLGITIFNEYEWFNSLRLAEYRRLRNKSENQMILRAYESDKEKGLLQWIGCDLGVVFEEAKRLTIDYTSREGYRSFNILHVAAAIQSGASIFLTFDVHQKKLAQAEGLKVPL